MATGIICCDIDDTLLKSNPKDIGVWKIKDGKKTYLSTEEFAKDPDKDLPDVKYDCSEFSDPIKIRKSILNGTPLLSNLKIVDDYLSKGYDFCFLTARGGEDVIKEVMTDFMKYNGPNGMEELGDRFKKGLSYAISDEKYMEVLDGMDHPERKAHVLKMICDMYDQVVFIDDDLKNLVMAKNLRLPNLKVIRAKDH